MQWTALDPADLPDRLDQTSLVALRMDIIRDALVLQFFEGTDLRSEELRIRRCVFVAVTPIMSIDLGLGNGVHIFSSASVHDASVHTEPDRVRLKLNVTIPSGSSVVEIVGGAFRAVTSEPHACSVWSCPSCDVASGIALLLSELRNNLPLIRVS